MDETVSGISHDREAIGGGTVDDAVLEAVLARFGDRWPASVACGPGWYQLVADCDRELAAMCEQYVLCQVKEKFAGLRYYFSLPDDIADDDEDGLWTRMLAIARRYEERSFTICEETGRAGVLMRNGNWYKTLSPERDWEGFEVVGAR
jgi:hypothetical protein